MFDVPQSSKSMKPIPTKKQISFEGMDRTHVAPKRGMGVAVGRLHSSVSYAVVYLVSIQNAIAGYSTEGDGGASAPICC